MATIRKVNMVLPHPTKKPEKVRCVGLNEMQVLKAQIYRGSVGWLHSNRRFGRGGPVEKVGAHWG